jgi:hypothetical protein
MKYKTPYLFHLAFDLVVYLAVRHFFGFEVAIIFILTNIGCDVYRGFCGWLKGQE